MNAGDLITTDIVFYLWHQFLQEEAVRAQTLPLRSPNVPPRAALDDVDGGSDDIGENGEASRLDEKQRLT